MKTNENQIDIDNMKKLSNKLADAYQVRATARISALEADLKNNIKRFEIYDEITKEGSCKTIADKESQTKIRLLTDSTTQDKLDCDKQQLRAEANVCSLLIEFKCACILVAKDKEEIDVD